MMHKKGKVYLVGAGSGDAGLITVKGLETIKNGDVIIYDRLVNKDLLRAAKKDAELIYVGKSAKKHTYKQEEINQLLIEKAKEGKMVTRLKGGDPFIFGRGGEEGEELFAAGVEFEIVPGITSSIAAPAYGGIPLTHRDFSSAVTIVTGHEDPAKEESAIAWEELAQNKGTLVFLMGVGNLPNIVEQLKKYGRPPETPVALIRWGSWTRQRTVVGELDNIVSKVREAGLKPPAVIVVGDVVKLRKKLNWFENKPLFGKKIMITRASHQIGSMTRQLEELGAQVIEAPTIEIAPPDDFQPIDESIEQLNEYNWLIFTSVNGVEYFMERLFEKGLDVRSLGHLKLATIGTATGRQLEEYGLKADYIPHKFVAEELAAGLGEVTDLKNAHILLPRAASTRPVLVENLKEAGAEVREVDAYQTLVGKGCQDMHQLLQDGQVDIITFTASSTARNMAQLVEPVSFGTLLEKVTVACIGPITAGTVKELGGHVDIVAEEHTIKGLIDSFKE